MSYDYSKLNGKIIEVCGTRNRFASLMGMAEATMSLKLNNKAAFKQTEIEKALEILHIKVADLGSYFFAKQAQ